MPSLKSDGWKMDVPWRYDETALWRTTRSSPPPPHSPAGPGPPRLCRSETPTCRRITLPQRSYRLNPTFSHERGKVQGVRWPYLDEIPAMNPARSPAAPPEAADAAPPVGAPYEDGVDIRLNGQWSHGRQPSDQDREANEATLSDGEPVEVTSAPAVAWYVPSRTL